MTFNVQSFYDKRSGTASHVLWCVRSRRCAVIDPVFDLDPKSGHTSPKPIDDMSSFIREMNLTLDWVLETHIHHDHISGAAALRRRLGGRIAIGRRVGDVAAAITRVYGLSTNDGNLSAFDRQLADGEQIELGNLMIHVIATPGHTLDHLSYAIGNAVFTGDTLFMPDSGTARCDFHKGDPSQLYRSIKRILERPDDTILYACHDYGANGQRAPAWQSTVGAQRQANIHVGRGTTHNAFVTLRRKRDSNLDMPALMLHSLPLNIRGGELPVAAAHGRVMLSIPLNVARDAI